MNFKLITLFPFLYHKKWSFTLPSPSFSTPPIHSTRNGHVLHKETKNVTYFLKICGWSKKILININRLNNIIRFGIENAIK